MKLDPLTIGQLTIWPPVILAPMAGITDYPFRKLCLDMGAGLAISEMVTAHCLLANNARTQKIASFYKDGYLRSIQLYGADPTIMGAAVNKLIQMNHVDHIDLNFGCPVKKITSKGGGAAVPYQSKLFAKIIREAVKNAKHIPVTIKFRMGLDNDYLYYLEAGKIAQEEGVAAVTLHARTAQQLYSGKANWDAIAELKHALCYIPVLGNGDLHSYDDITRMRQITHCDGFVIGRGCLGKPWLFSDMKRLAKSYSVCSTISSVSIIKIMLKHLAKQVCFSGEASAMKSFRKQMKWYMMDLPNGRKIMDCFLSCRSYRSFLSEIEPLIIVKPINKVALSCFKGKQNPKNKVSLPKGFMLLKNTSIPFSKEAELLVSGG